MRILNMREGFACNSSSTHWQEMTAYTPSSAYEYTRRRLDVVSEGA